MINIMVLAFSIISVTNILHIKKINKKNVLN